MAVQLIIKTPNQNIGDLQIECDMTWTVEKIKNHLCDVYPTKPRKEEQKLIYCGRLLHDHLLLKDILRQVQGVHTMHLVCPSPIEFDENETKSPKEIITDDNSSSEHFSNRLQASPSLNTLNSDGLRQRLFDSSQQQTSEQNIPSSFPQFQLPLVSASMPEVPVASPAMAYQVAAMQQMYAQFMAQYLTQAQAGIQNFQYGSFPTPHMTVIPPTQTPPAPVHNIPEQQINPNPVVNIREQRLQNDDDEALGRDLLDWIYITSRVMVLFTVLYFYSSFGRILLVTILGLLLFVYRSGLFGRRHHRSSSVPRPADDVGGQRENARGENSGVGNDSNENASDIHTSQNEVQPEDNEQQQSPNDELLPQRDPHVSEEDSGMQSPFIVAWTFFSSFFTSLIPEQPVPVNVN